MLSPRGGRRGPLLGLALVLLLFVAIELAWVLLVKVGHFTDEYSHLAYVDRIVHHHQLPGATQPEKQQPPLYYLLGALVETAGGGVRAVRLLSVVLAGLTLVAVASITALVLPHRRWAPVLAAAMVGLLPSIEAVSAAVSDDSLANLSGALLLLLTVVILRQSPPNRRTLGMVGLGVGLALLTKETDWPLAALPLAAVLWASSPARRLANVTGVAAGAAVVAGWWFVRNLVAFHALTPPLGPITTGPNPKLRSLSRVRTLVSATERSLFGATDATGGVLPRSSAATAASVLLAALIVAGLAGALVVLRRRWPQLSPDGRAVAVALASATWLALAALLANSVLITLEPQARYLLVAVAAPATAIAALLTGTRGRRHAGWVLAGIAVSGLALAAVAADSLRVAAGQS